MVTFPTVASAHLITQVKNYSQKISQGNWTISQIHASMAASLTITETYLPICVILLFIMILPLPRRANRIVLLALTGLFGVVSEVYLFFSVPSIQKTPRVFGRFFIVDSFPLLITTLVLASILVSLLLAFIYLLLRQQYPEPVAGIPEDANPEGLELYRGYEGMELLGEKCPTYDLTLLSYMSFLFLPMSFVTALFSTFQDMPRIVANPRGLFQEFFPSTKSSIMDLDQAVALLAGMTVFGFSLYSAANERYRIWWEAEKAEKERAVREMIDGLARVAERARHLRPTQTGRTTESGDVELQSFTSEHAGATAGDNHAGEGTEGCWCSWCSALPRR